VLSTLLDSGALVALFDPSAEEHLHYRDELPGAGMLLTTWPCVTEALHILPRLAMKLALLGWISAKAISVHAFESDDVAAMIEWIKRYSERREMDFADASLVWLANTTGCRRIMTTDVRDFTRYRLAGAKSFEIV
jgi:predicted nucleic acid-binding protein